MIRGPIAASVCGGPESVGMQSCRPKLPFHAIAPVPIAELFKRRWLAYSETSGTCLSNRRWQKLPVEKFYVVRRRSSRGVGQPRVGISVEGGQ